MTDRVKYFPIGDLCCGMNLNKIESLEIPDINAIDINDAIEYYEINRYFEDGVCLKNCSDKQNEEYYKKSNDLFSITMRFFKLLDDANIYDHYSLVDPSYKSSFWRLFDKCRL